jgi:predicted nucleotidyltransferase
MDLAQLKKLRKEIYQIAAKYGVKEVFVFGSVARGDETNLSDVDFLIEMESGESAFGVGAFQFEVQKLLGIQIDVVPTFALPNVDDRNFVQSLQREAILL